MTVAVNYQPNHEHLAPAGACSAAGIVSVEIFDNLTTAEPFWRRLEDGRALMSAYQRFDLLAAWQQHMGARAGVTPFIVAGFDRAGEPVFLWPLGCKRVGTIGVAQFLGSKHSNFNIGLWRRDVAGSITLQDFHTIRARIAATGRADVLALYRLPMCWDGVDNPFMLLPHQASVDMSALLTVPESADVIGTLLSASMRGRLRNKERRLERLPGYRYLRVAPDEEVDRLLDAFFALKSTHMAAHGIANFFGEAGVVEFLREACHHKLPNGEPLIELHALEGDGEVLALFGAVIDEYRFSAMFNTYTLGDHGRQSPGLVLLTHMISDCAQRGSRTFDIGVGRAHYKSFFCKETEPLFDIFLPVTLRGRAVAPALSAISATKRLIKHTPALWAAVQGLRRLRARPPAAQ